MGFHGEKVFEGVRDINYLHQAGNTKILVVIFSGFPIAGKPPVYNYIRTLNDIDCHKLFILDNHNDNHYSKATYYLGKNRSHDVEMSVVALITKVANENNIPRERIVICGSSKGAFAALYYGLKYSYGYVVCGGPTIFLGNYLIDKAPGARGVAEYIAGSIDEESKQYLNNLMFSIPIKNYPDIHLHIGRGDPRYEGDVLPFLKYLEQKGVPYNIDIGEYSEHGEMSKHFPPFLISKVNSIINKIADADIKLQLTEERLKIIEDRLNKIYSSKSWRFISKYRELRKRVRSVFVKSK